MSERFDCSDPAQLEAGLQEAQAALRRGQLVVMPTDTVYGIAAEAFDPVAVYRLLESQGCPEDVCRAGMFHSIYGTEKFQGFTLPLGRRDEVRALIGDRAERLAYLNCAMDRASFDRALDRREGMPAGQ